MSDSASAIGGSTVAQNAAIVRLGVDSLPPYGKFTLPAGIRSRIIKNVNGLAIHMLEAGFETKGRPLILLLHGFPELAYSWRKIMLPLAAAAITWLPLINAATDARPDGMTRMTATLIPFASPTLSGTRWVWSRRLAIVP
jgi:hypothetical protein